MPQAKNPELDRRRIYITYPESYIENVRNVWYSLERPGMEKVHDAIPDFQGNKPSIPTLLKWKERYMWDFWADGLDLQVSQQVQDKLVAQRASMLERHAIMSQEMQDMAFDYLKAEGFDTSSSAVNAIVKGIEIERESRGISEYLVRMTQMSNDELLQEIVKSISDGVENNQLTFEAEEIEQIENKKDDKPEEAADTIDAS